ncbi:MAG: ABC transporter substrate-binding protein [Rubrimonas sp.]
MTHLFRAAFALALAFAAALPLRAEPVLRIATLERGTVQWELQTILREGLDRREGVTLEVQGLAGKSATDIALLGGAADAIVTDWFWVARQRAMGRDYVFIPYSTAVGGLVVAEGSDIRSLADLAGRTVGVAGGPLDKSWLLLQALAKKRHGIDLGEVATPVFGAPPLIHQKALSGEIDAAINFWHFLAKLEARDFRMVASVADAAEELGLDPRTPLLGYVLPGAFAAGNPETVAAFARASQAAKALLLADDAAWAPLRPLMDAEVDAEFAALVAGWRAGAPDPGPVDAAAAARLYAFMADLGGEELVGPALELPEGVFWNGL